VQLVAADEDIDAVEEQAIAGRAHTTLGNDYILITRETLG
jgi:hypothetical protein